MIHNRSDIPVDSTYFRVGAAEPDINSDGSIIIYNATGSRRSWGRPQVNSTIIVDAPDFVAVHVGFSHKHGGGQFWRYYNVNGSTRQVQWKDLDDETRQVVLDEAAKKAPSWAKSPGKLRSEYRTPKQNAFVGYKIVALEEDGTLRGLYNPEVIYQIGKTKIERARPDHSGGFYTYSDPNVDEAYRDGKIYGDPVRGRYAVAECTCWGTRISYGQSKVSSTYCRPDRIIKTFQIA